MRFRSLCLVAALAIVGCRQATAAEVGAHDRDGAFSRATMMASERSSSVAPGTVPPIAKGTPMMQPPAR